MKTDKFKEEINALNIDEMIVKLHSLHQEMCSLRLDGATNPVKDVSRYAKLRRNIARVLTRVRQMGVRA